MLPVMNEIAKSPDIDAYNSWLLLVCMERHVVLPNLGTNFESRYIAHDWVVGSLIEERS